MDEASAAKYPYIASMGLCILHKYVLQDLLATFADLSIEWKMLEHARDRQFAMKWCVFTDLFEGSWGKSLADVHAIMDEYREVCGLQASLHAPSPFQG